VEKYLHHSRKFDFEINTKPNYISIPPRQNAAPFNYIKTTSACVGRAAVFCLGQRLASCQRHIKQSSSSFEGSKIKMEESRYFETSGTTLPATRRRIAEVILSHAEI